MEGFEKINLETPTAPSKGKDFVTTMPMTQRKKMQFSLFSKKGLIVSGVIIFLVLFGIFGVFLPVKKTYNQAKITQADAQATLYGLKIENIQIASDQLT